MGYVEVFWIDGSGNCDVECELWIRVFVLWGWNVVKIVVKDVVFLKGINSLVVFGVVSYIGVN